MKLAIVTTSQRFQDAVTTCFTNDTTIVPFADDKALIRALTRDMFEAILMEASDTAALRESRPLFVSRHCQSRLQVPLILVGHFASRASLDLAFSLGADDIVRLPIDQDELFVRTSRAIQRAQQDPVTGETLRLSEYRLEKRIGVVVFNGQTVQLTPREFAIAWMLFSRPGQYLSRKQISIAIWGCGEEVAGRTLEQHIYKLRKKLLLTGAHGVRLSTQYAHGYRVETFGALDQSSTPPTTADCSTSSSGNAGTSGNAIDPNSDATSNKARCYSAQEDTDDKGPLALDTCEHSQLGAI